MYSDPREKIKEGWLIKSPPPENNSRFGMKSQWRRRWFVLHEPTNFAALASPLSRAFGGDVTCTVKTLYYYTSQNTEKKCKGTILLRPGIRVEDVIGTVNGYSHVINVVTRDRIYHLSADSAVEKREWLEALQEHVQNDSTPQREDSLKEFLDPEVSQCKEKVDYAAPDNELARQVQQSVTLARQPNPSRPRVEMNMDSTSFARPSQTSPMNRSSDDSLKLSGSSSAASRSSTESSTTDGLEQVRIEAYCHQSSSPTKTTSILSSEDNTPSRPASLSPAGEQDYRDSSMVDGAVFEVEDDEDEQGDEDDDYQNPSSISAVRTRSSSMLLINNTTWDNERINEINKLLSPNANDPSALQDIPPIPPRIPYTSIQSTAAPTLPTTYTKSRQLHTTQSEEKQDIANQYTRDYLEGLGYKTVRRSQYQEDDVSTNDSASSVQ